MISITIQFLPAAGAITEFPYPLSLFFPFFFINLLPPSALLVCIFMGSIARPLSVPVGPPRLEKNRWKFGRHAFTFSSIAGGIAPLYVRIYVCAGLAFSINHFLSILPSERSNLGTKISHRYRYQYFSMVSSRDIGGAGWWDERMGDVGGRRECDIYRPVGTPAQLKISN